MRRCGRWHRTLSRCPKRSWRRHRRMRGICRYRKCSSRWHGRLHAVYRCRRRSGRRHRWRRRMSQMAHARSADAGSARWKAEMAEGFTERSPIWAAFAHRAPKAEVVAHDAVPSFSGLSRCREAHSLLLNECVPKLRAPEPPNDNDKLACSPAVLTIVLTLEFPLPEVSRLGRLRLKASTLNRGEVATAPRQGESPPLSPFPRILDRPRHLFCTHRAAGFRPTLHSQTSAESRVATQYPASRLTSRSRCSSNTSPMREARLPRLTRQLHSSHHSASSNRYREARMHALGSESRHRPPAANEPLVQYLEARPER